MKTFDKDGQCTDDAWRESSHFIISIAEDFAAGKIQQARLYKERDARLSEKGIAKASKKAWPCHTRGYMGSMDV